MERREQLRGPYIVRAILLDSDRRGATPARDRELERIADEYRLMLVWQDPSFEALLLRHLAGCHDLRPATSTAAHATLKAHWPTYEKPAPAIHIAARISFNDVQRIRAVEPMLDNLLRALGFPKP